MIRLSELTRTEQECLSLLILAVVALISLMIAYLGYWGLIVVSACIGYIMAVCVYPFIPRDEDAL